jgi:hypothetical protein
VEVIKASAHPKIYSGIKTYAKAEALVLSLVESLNASDVRGAVGALKFEIRREEDATMRLTKIAECFELLKGETHAAKTEPSLAAELLLLRSKEVMRRNKFAAEADARMAAKLRPDWGPAEFQLGSVLEASGRLDEAARSLQRSLHCMNVDEKTVRRQLARVTRKLESTQCKPHFTAQCADEGFATPTKPQQASNAFATNSTDPAPLPTLLQSLHIGRHAAAKGSAHAKTTARAKQEVVDGNFLATPMLWTPPTLEKVTVYADSANMASNATTTADTSRKSTLCNEDSFDMSMFDEDDSELFEDTMQAMQASKVSLTLQRLPSCKQRNSRITNKVAKATLSSNFESEQATGTVVAKLRAAAAQCPYKPSAPPEPPTFSMFLSQSCTDSLRPSKVGSAAEDEAMPVF